MLSLDGAYGEGGGQVLRTALSLAALTGVAVRIEGIRAQRSKPGLRPQHLTTVQAVARVSQGEVTGARLGSQALTFKPRTLQGGHYCFDVAETPGSAGAVTLVAQAEDPSRLTTEAVTSHLLTNSWVIEQFPGPGFQVQGNPGEPGEIFCQGR